MTPPTGTKRQRNVARREIMQVGALSLFAGMSVSRFLDVATADEASSDGRLTGLTHARNRREIRRGTAAINQAEAS